MKPTLMGRIESELIHLATTSEQIGKFKAKDEIAGKSNTELVTNLEKARDDIYVQIKRDLILLKANVDI